MFRTNNKISKKQVSLLVGDIIIIQFAFFISPIIRMGYDGGINYIFDHPYSFILSTFIYLIVFYIFDLYDFKKDYRRPKVSLTVAGAVVTAFVICAFLFYLHGPLKLGRGVFLLNGILILLGIILWRRFYSLLAVRGVFIKRALVVGAGKGGRQVAQLIRNMPNPDIKLMGFIDKDAKKIGKSIEGVKVLGSEDRLISIVEEKMPDLIIVALRPNRYESLMKDLLRCSQKGTEIRDMVSFCEEVSGKISTKYISNLWLLLSSINQSRLHIKRVKRLMDVSLSILILMVSLPVTLLTALAIKLDSPGDVFYRQERLGKDGKLFRLIKFRSMV